MNLEPSIERHFDPGPLLLLNCQTVVFAAWQTEFSVFASQMGLIETSSLGFMLADDYSSLTLHSLLILVFCLGFSC